MTTPTTTTTTMTIMSWFVRHPKNGEDSKTPRMEVRWDRVRLAVLAFLCFLWLPGKLGKWVWHVARGGGGGGGGQDGRRRRKGGSPAVRVDASLQDGRLADFVICGFPQGGSVALGHSLRRQGHVLLAEYNGFHQSETDEDAVQQLFRAYRKAALQQADSIASSPLPLRLGLLNPEEVYHGQGLRRFHWMGNDDVKCVVGIRHPLLMFQTYFNWRVQEWYHPSWMTGQGVIPHPMDLLQGEWAGVSAKFLQWERFLKPLLEDSSFSVFVFFQSQLEDANAAQQAAQEAGQRGRRRGRHAAPTVDAFTQDLMHFLELEEPMGTYDTMDVDMEGDFPERLDICLETYATLRRALLENAQVTREFLQEALHTQRIVVGDRERFMTLLQEMGESPCRDQIMDQEPVAEEADKE